MNIPFQFFQNLFLGLDAQLLFHDPAAFLKADFPAYLMEHSRAGYQGGL
jgi:hypothetical protein